MQTEQDSRLAKVDRSTFIMKVERFMARHRDQVVWVHVVMFLLFCGVVLAPVFFPVPDENATPSNNFPQFANFLLWGVWFPMVLASVLFTGRSWCGLMCPMGACSEWANRIGPKRMPPAWLRWEGTPVVSFLLVTIWGQTIGVRGYADSTAIVFGSLMAAAIIIGFLYGGRSAGRRKGKRPWCRHMCPVGLLLGIFSRLGAVQFVPKRPRPGGDTLTEKGICPTYIYITRKAESRHCIECFRCVRPDAKGGLFVQGRRVGIEVGNIRNYNPNATEVWFLFLGGGVALGGVLWVVLPLYTRLRDLIGAWFIERELFWIAKSGPMWLMSVHPDQREIFNWLDFFTISGFMLAVAAVVAGLLGATTAATAWLAGRSGGDRTFSERFVELGYQFAPVAMVSLLIGLGDKLFTGIARMGSPSWSVEFLKAGLLLGGFAWSLLLANRILARQGVIPKFRWLPMIPGAAGSLAVAMVWWTAIFGI